MTLWEIVTGNSSLPIAQENTFWDHLNNQQGSSVVGLKYDANIQLSLQAEIKQSYTANIICN